ncbi:MAG: hypothetical protein KKF44_10970 [Nanoarchaeota archaeon]|nr:hypothetical protein [Nanoarchaeota archaeon]
MGEFDLVFITNRYYKDILHDVGHIRRWEATGANVKVLVLGEDAHNGSRLNPNPGERVEVENLEDRLKEINADLNIWYRLDTKDKIDPDASQYGTFQYIPVALRLMSNMLEKTMVVSNLGLTERLAELYETKDKFLSVEDYFDWSEDVILEKRNTHLGKITAKKASIRLFVKEDPEGAQHHIWTPSGLHELTPHRYQLLKHIVENGILEIDDLIAFPDVKELFGDIGRAWVLEKLNITLKAIDPDRKYLRSLEGIRGKTHKYWFYCGNIQNYKINNEKFRDIEFDRELGWITIQSGNNYKYGVLTQSELALLSLLIDNAGIPLSFQTILKKLKYGSKSESAIRDLFSNLEKKN